MKEKELKKIKFNQLLIDTQATFMQEAAIKGINSGARHSNTVHEPARGSEPLSTSENNKDGGAQNENNDEKDKESAARDS